MLNCLFFRIFSSVSFVSLYQTKAQRSGFCLELRSKGAERGMPSPAGRYTRSGLCDEVVGVGFCPQTAFGGQPGHRRLAKCDAGSFVGTSSISFTSAQSAKAHPFRCASSQNRNRVAGLRFCVFFRTLAQRWLLPVAAHTLAGWAERPHTAATRASRRAAGARHTRRVDRDDFFRGGKIGTNGPFQADEALSVALSKRD